MVKRSQLSKEPNIQQFKKIPTVITVSEWVNIILNLQIQ